LKKCNWEDNRGWGKVSVVVNVACIKNGVWWCDAQISLINIYMSWCLGCHGIAMFCHLRKKKWVKVNNEEHEEGVVVEDTVALREREKSNFLFNQIVPTHTLNSFPFQPYPQHTIHRCSRFSLRLHLPWPLFLVPGFVFLSLFPSSLLSFWVFDFCFRA